MQILLTTGWNFMKKKSEDESWFNLDPIFESYLDHCLDTKENHLDFPINLLLCGLAEVCAL